MLMKEIKDLNATIRRHGEAHLAHDLLPQFTELVKKVEKIEGSLNYKLNDGPIHNHSIRIAKLEELLKFEGRAQQDQNRRLTDHDESIEALSETVDQLSTCKCEAGAGMLKRIAELEESNTVFLKSIPDVEILKTQMAGIKSPGIDLIKYAEITNKQIAQLQEIVYNSPFSKIVMEQYAENIKTLVRDVDTLKIQMHNLIPVHNNMMDEILKQKAFLGKVQGILDRERDDRIKKTPGYKKEIAAMKMDANAPKDANGRSGFSMDKHVDMMVKKGRPRKP
jgi:hypothetical protein